MVVVCINECKYVRRRSASSDVNVSFLFIDHVASLVPCRSV